MVESDGLISYITAVWLFEIICCNGNLRDKMKEIILRQLFFKAVNLYLNQFTLTL